MSARARRGGGRALVTLLCAGLCAVACDRDLERLERARTSAELRLAELERASRGLRRLPVAEVAAWQRAMDDRLPDLPRGALTASVALALAGLAGASVVGEGRGELRGQLLTEPLVAAVPRELAHVRALLERLDALERPWMLDAVTSREDRLQVAIHGYVFAPGSVGDAARARLDPGPDEGTVLARERDRVRRVTRALVERVEATRAALGREGIEGPALDAYRKAELKQSLLEELDRVARRQREDAGLVLRSLVEARAPLRSLTFTTRAGRRLCDLRVETLEAKNDVFLVGTSRYGLAADAKRLELTLPSGRVCAVGVGSPPR